MKLSNMKIYIIFSIMISKNVVTIE